MFAPWEYQQDCLRKLDKVRSQGAKRALVVMASGLGKTLTAAFDLKNWLMTHIQARILYLCHQNYILDQAKVKFEAVIGGDTRLYGSYYGTEKNRHARYLFASFQTMRENLKKFDRKEFDFIIVDESHHAPADTYQPIVKYFQPQFLLGMTATPDRRDLKDMRKLFGGEEIYSLPLEEALARHLLTPVDYRLVTDEIAELGEIENPCRMSLRELNKKIFVPKRDEEIVQIICEKIARIKDPRVMIFCPSIDYAERLHIHIPRSFPIHSNLSVKEERERIEAFRNGIIQTVLTVDKFNEGIDIPEVNVVVFLRSTQSQTIFYQQLGRGLRRAEGKKKVLILDFVANCDRIIMVHNLVEKIQREDEKEGIERGSYLKEQMVVNFGGFHFTETAQNVLEILRKMREGYTQQVLIDQLQAEARRLGKIPTKRHIAESSKKGRTASLTVFAKVFGSHNKALIATGLEVTLRQGRYTRKKLIHQLQAEKKRLGRTPTSKDLLESSKRGRTASQGVFQRTFGSHNQARLAAGLEVSGPYTKKELIHQLQAEARRLGRIPRIIDIRESSKKGRTAFTETLVRVFGSHNKALIAAGLEVNQTH